MKVKILIIIGLFFSNILFSNSYTTLPDKINGNRYRVIHSSNTLTDDDIAIDTSLIKNGKNFVKAFCNKGDEVITGGCILSGLFKEHAKIITSIPLIGDPEGWLCTADVNKPKIMKKEYEEDYSSIAVHVLCKNKK